MTPFICRSRYGPINAFPFNAGSSTKALREWTRGLGPDTNVKGVKQHAAQSFHVPDNVTRPATNNDYLAVTGEALSGP